MKKNNLFLGSIITTITTFFILGSTIPVFATTLNQPGPDETIISQGPSYTITSSKHSIKSTDQIKQPLSTTNSYSMTNSTTKAFNGQDNSFPTGNLAQTSQTNTITTQHAYLGSDYIYTYGEESAYYASSNCTNVTLQPSIAATATAVDYAFSVPAGVSVSASNNTVTQTFTAQSITPTKGQNTNYYWPQVAFDTSQHFTDLKMSAYCSYTIGGSFYGESDLMDITITQ